MRMLLSISSLRPAIGLAAATVLSACAANAGLPANGPQAANPQAAQELLRPASGSGINKIQHIVIVIQENRSLDNLFQGYPGANTQSYGYDSQGTKIALQQVPLEIKWDIDHSSKSFFAACNGTGSYPGTNCQMNGFDNEYWYCGKSGYPSCPIQYPPYAYVPPSETKPYVQMAQQYVLADHMFASNFDASSFVAHQYLIAAQSSSAVNYPDSTYWGCEGGSGDTIMTVTQQRKIDWGHRIQVCFNNETLGDELDGANISWKYYTGPGLLNYWSAYSAISHIYYGSDWKKVVSPQKLFLSDVQYGQLPTISWVTPTCANSDHAGCGGNGGPDWVASIVNAVGQSQYWNSTAIFVVWDDYGGWYDHVPPVKLDYDGLGIRVPFLVISPYAKKNYVSHVHYELASVVRFIENRYGLKTLSASDARATSPAGDCFNFNRSPRPFIPIQTKRGPAYFMHEAPDFRPPDNE